VDREDVEEGNFNRLGFTRTDIGKPKSEAVARNVESLRNNENIEEKFHLQMEAFKADIIGWRKLSSLIEEADVVFSCLDNSESRRELNFYVMKEKTPMIDGATSRLGYGGTVITVQPHPEKPCYECLVGASTGVNIDNVPRVGHCDASLAHTMAIIASLQIDQALKLLFGYGEVSPLLKVRMQKKTLLNRVNAKRRINCPVHKRFFSNETGAT
ncbi:MAG: ThiF family adenylyltransferase, partial [Candidatus Korarchaeota archaeon]|nr:ThiF family adenylyltransferase [Candidatus Korarchaeota archaeon]NIU83847.1 hypothetical protein [Candidatus Thorarchaeota archaeon]NIW13989.1 hypothetical protein [Candidatus Thorarchaeota archaeon]NIW53605.1 hypothetical protein [Candidatus Korarchaeota archaeon]